jgi:hypothetical protein
VAASNTHDNRWTNACGASQGFPAADKACEWGGQNPVQKTGQCDDALRTRVRFWNGKDCGSDPACLVIAGMAASTELAHGVPWQGSGLGLDEWALRNTRENRERAGATDSNGGGVTWGCYGGASGSQSERRWELAGYALTQGCSYTLAVASFHAWEGGTGMFDCENLYFRFGKAGESYVSAVSYGFGAAALP